MTLWGPCKNLSKKQLEGEEFEKQKDVDKAEGKTGWRAPDHFNLQPQEIFLKMGTPWWLSG